jgi:hypothetical protein
MADSSSSVLPASLAQAQQQFEQWRGEQPKRSRLPEELWSLAVDVACRCGVGRTAKALRLDHNKLKAKCRTSQSLASESMAFLELRPQRGPVECTIDYQRSSDIQTIRVILSGPDWPDLNGLFQGFWRS